MASTSFGRKGRAVDMVDQQPARRRQFGQAATRPAATSEPSDPLSNRRDAFLAAERARTADAEQGADEGAPVRAGASGTMPPRGKSLGSAYVLWLFLGGFSAHRFYLGSPLTAIAQVSVWYISLMFFMAGQSGAGYLVTGGWLWILGDAFVIPKLCDAANEKIRRRAERLPEPVSS